MPGYHSLRRKAAPICGPRPVSSIEISIELLASEIPSVKHTSGAPTIDYIQDSVPVGDGPVKQLTAFYIFLRTLQLDTLYNRIRGLFGHGLNEEEPSKLSSKVFL